VVALAYLRGAFNARDRDVCRRIWSCRFVGNDRRACTSTLELGIDIGSVRSVAQIGAPRSMSSPRQRLGRTGRRPGMPQILALHVREPCITNKSSVLDRLRTSNIRAVATTRLLDRFVEPASPGLEVGSTLIHQILAAITERSGIRPRPLYDLLCGAEMQRIGEAFNSARPILSGI
jgi:Lhr-like helicase